MKTLDELLREAMQMKGSDVFIIPFSPVSTKANGKMVDRYLDNDIIRALIDDDGSGHYDIEPLMDWLKAAPLFAGPRMNGKLETLAAREFWPIPVYSDLLFSV